MATHNELGRWGEELAAEHLRRQGYYIVRRDWRYGHRDIDIVAVTPDRRTIVIVEVKTRRNNLFMQPEQAVTPQKMRSLATAADAFVRELRVNAGLRFDIVTVTGTDAATATVEHIEDAFTPYL